MEIASTAARLIVEDGLEYAAAKRKAARMLGRRSVGPTDLPGNDLVEAEVRAYIQAFCPETQADELRALRELALHWMQRLAEFRPHLTGAAWHGTATRHSDVHLQLFCDDSKAAEIALLNQGIDYRVGSTRGLRGQPVDVLTVHSYSEPLGADVPVHLAILDHDELRGALRPDSQGRPPRGDARALAHRLAQEPVQPT